MTAHRSGPAPLAAGGIAAAALLGALALQAGADARRAERENPPRGRFLSAGGTRLHLLDAGPADGPPVVLLHGNAVTAEDFVASGVFGALSRRHRVVAFDRPGYGHSDRPRDRDWGARAQAALFAEAVARLGLRRPVVVGHSWGVLPAIAMALDHGEAAGGLVLLSGYHFPTLRADVVLFSPPALPVLGDVIRYTTGPLAGRLIAPPMIRLMFRPQPVPPAFEAGVPVDMMLRPWQIRASAEDAAHMTPRVAEAQAQYAELGRLPVAILAGAEDRVVNPRRHSARLHDAVPGSLCEILPGAGHMVHHAAPLRVAAAVAHVAALRGAGRPAARPAGAAAPW